MLRTLARPLIGSLRSAGSVATMLVDRGRHVAAENDFVHVELRDLDVFELERLGDTARPRLVELTGVRWAEIHPWTHRFVVAVDDRADPAGIVAVVESVEDELGFGGRDYAAHRTDHPTDIEPIVRDLANFGADVVSVGVGVTVQLLGLRPPPFELDLSALVSVTEGPTPLRKGVERRIGRPAAEVVLGAANALAQGLTAGPLGPAVDLAHRSMVFREILARREVWQEREPELFAHPPARESVVVPVRPRPVPAGPVETYAEQAWTASLAGFGVGLVATRRLEGATAVLQAGLPKAARLGREGFRAELGRLLARRGALVLEPDALRLLDRVDEVIVDRRLLDSPAHRPVIEALPIAAARAEVSLAATGGPGTLPDGWSELADPDPVGCVQQRQHDGAVVLLVHSSASVALAAADIGVGVVDGRGVPWGADLILGEDLAELVVVLEAVARARAVSAQSVRLAAAGSIAGAAVSLTGVVSPAAARLLAPVNLAAGVALANGSRHARQVRLRPVPVRRDPVPWHALRADEVIDRLGTSFLGLGEDDAAGRSRTATRAASAPVRLARNVAGELANPLTPVLAAGAALSATVGSVADAGLVTGVMGLSGLIGGVQQFRADQATAALQRTRPQAVRVLREGEPVEVDPTRLVQGDVVVLEAGEVVPADCRIVQAASLQIDESALTGEPFPVLKNEEPVAREAAVADRTSMLFDGTWVAAGEAVAVVVATGDGTEAARAVALVAEAASGGVEARLGDLTRRMVPISVLGGAAVVAVGALRGRPLRESVGSGVSLAVAAVPEGLPLVATAAQLSVARRLARQNVLVRNPRAIEALGRTDVLCADKTGTLTEGRIRLQMVSDGTAAERVDELGPAGAEVLRTALRATPADREGGLPHPTDRAVVAGGDANGVDPGDGRQPWTELASLAFEPARGYHATLGRLDGEHLVACKGAPEIVLARCATWRRGEYEVPLDEAARQELAAGLEALTDDAMRVLAVAERSVPAGESFDDSMVEGLCLRGFVGLADVVRSTAANAVDLLSQAGVRTIMITGDHPGTAAGIGAELGLGGRGLTGAEIDHLTDDELGSVLSGVTRVARVSPAHKVRIVRALQHQGRVVAMTGDGANDAPAIRLADVGIALGRRSTGAAQSAADLVVLDEDIETIVGAVLEGRAMWSSVREAVAMLVGGNLGEILFTVSGSLLDGVAPLNTRQLLLVNLLTDALPAMAIATRRPPVLPPEQLLVEGPESSLGESLDRAIALRAVCTASAAGAAYLLARLTGTRQRARTTALVSLVGTQLGQTVAGSGRDPVVLAAGFGSMAALGAVVQTPVLSQLFGCRPIGPVAMGIAGATAVGGTVASRLVPLVWPSIPLPGLDALDGVIERVAAGAKLPT